MKLIVSYKRLIEKSNGKSEAIVEDHNLSCLRLGTYIYNSDIHYMTPEDTERMKKDKNDILFRLLN